MINETELKEKRVVKILQRIGIIIVATIIYATLCVLFFKLSKFEGAHDDLFICGTVCFSLGLLCALLPKAIYRFMAWMMSKSEVWDEPISFKRFSKPFFFMTLAWIAFGYILLGISILINIL